MIMQGKKGLIMGLANKFSIAYGISEALRKQGAELLAVLKLNERTVHYL